MAEVAEGATSAATRTHRSGFDIGAAADARLRRELVDRAARRADSATWQSTLNESDLACLLGVIEAQLLPRLLREHRPVDRAPLQAFAKA